MYRSPTRLPPRTDFPLTTGRHAPCPRDLDCSCRGPQRDHGTINNGQPLPSRHLASQNREYHQPEQMEALQTSLDHFTDYEHYERCCDGHHHSKLGQDACFSDSASSHFPPTDLWPDFVDNCDDCIEEHQNCYDEVDVCDDDDDCEQCEEECEERGHEPDECLHDHPTTKDNCIPSHQVKPIPLPQLGPTSQFDTHAVLSMIQEITPCTSACSVPMQPAFSALDDPLTGLGFNSDMDHWQTFVQAHHCAPDPCVIGQPPRSQHPQHMDPAFGFTFGCDPMNSANQYPWQLQPPVCNVPLNILANTPSILSPQTQPSATPITSKMSMSSRSSETDTPTSASNSTPLVKPCEWIMPCGSICGAAFSRTEDLKKHIKNSHSTRGTATCGWKDCTASFATEAALTGHISKKHLTVSDEEGAWKCTFPGCAKSFMYKQVRDDHVASHNGGNRMHCPICHQWLNCEGSNFKRHMASHGPKNEYMKCRYESFGCKKRFPRLDNLRRHEACCKCGKKAAGVHHHHHRVHIGHSS